MKLVALIGCVILVVKNFVAVETRLLLTSSPYFGLKAIERNVGISQPGSLDMGEW